MENAYASVGRAGPGEGAKNGGKKRVFQGTGNHSSCTSCMPGVFAESLANDGRQVCHLDVKWLHSQSKASPAQRPGGQGTRKREALRLAPATLAEGLPPRRPIGRAQVRRPASQAPGLGLTPLERQGCARRCC